MHTTIRDKEPDECENRTIAGIGWTAKTKRREMILGHLEHTKIDSEPGEGIELEPLSEQET